MDLSNPSSRIGWIASGWSPFPWETFPAVDPAIEISLLVAVHVPWPAESLRHTLEPTIEFLGQRWGRAFEVLVAPFGESGWIDENILRPPIFG